MTTVVELHNMERGANHGDESILLYHQGFGGDIASEDHHEKKDSDQFKWKANTYKFTFNTVLFIQGLFVNCFYFFGLGLIIECFKLILPWKKLPNISSGFSLLSRPVKLFILLGFPVLLVWSIEDAETKKYTIQGIVKKILFIVICY